MVAQVISCKALGLRQEDPSSLLFFIIVEALSWLLERAVGGHYQSGFIVGCSADNVIKISHLLFGNDVLMFCWADLEQIWYVKGVFVWFQAIFGLKINLWKFELVLVGDVSNVEVFA